MGRWLAAGQAGAKDGRDVAQTPQRTHEPLSQAWDGHPDKTTNAPAGRVSLPTETCKQSRSYVFFPHRISQRGIDQDVTQEVVFFLFFMEI